MITFNFRVRELITATVAIMFSVYLHVLVSAHAVMRTPHPANNHMSVSAPLMS